jgi:hypothetical protein
LWNQIETDGRQTIAAQKEEFPDFDSVGDAGFLEYNYMVIILKGVGLKNMIHLIATWTLVFCCH